MPTFIELPELKLPLPPSSTRAHVHGKTFSFYRDGTSLVGVHKQSVHVCQNLIEDSEDIEEKLLLVEKNPSAIICFVQKKEVLIVNADLDKDEFYTERDGKTSISFRCLLRLLRPSLSEEILQEKIAHRTAKLLLSKDFRLHDASVDIRLPNTPKSRPLPNSGFTLVGQYWHRPASVLFSYKGHCYLMGQDENSYFGCELPKKVTTLNKAYNVLMPPSLRKSKIGWQRQGEWFSVPVSLSEVPAWEESLVSCDTECECIPLPAEQAGKMHRVYAYEFRVTTKGFFALNGYVLHTDHQKLFFNGWVRFLRNTAVRSVSQEGVD